MDNEGLARARRTAPKNSEGQTTAPAESPVSSSRMSTSSERTDHARKTANCNGEERANDLSQKKKRTDSTGLEHSCEAIQNVPSFDFIWTIEGFSLLPKLGRHFSETFDAVDLKWGLLLVPWYRMGLKRYLSLTLYLEDGTRDLEGLDDLTVSYKITMFNQGRGDDKEYRDTVAGVFARRIAGKWESIELVSLDAFLDPSCGFLVDDTCVFGVEILDVAPTFRRSLPASHAGRFRWTIRALSAKQDEKHCVYERFSAGGYDWIIIALIGRSQSLDSESLHIYLSLSSSHTLCQLFGRFRIRLVNQLTGNHIEKSYCSLFHAGKFHGCAGVVPLRTFYDQKEGFLVQNCCIVEVEVTVLAERPPQQVIEFYGGGLPSYTAAADEENAYHNPFAWDMSPYLGIFETDPGFDVTDLLLKHTHTSLDGHPLR